MPALLGFLAVLVLVLFAQVEQELKSQLQRASVYSVYVNEFVSADKAATLLRKSYEDEVMWSGKYGNAVTIVRQPLVSATWRRGQSMPVFSRTEPGEGLGAVDPEQDFPVASVLSKRGPMPDEWLDVYMGGRRLMVKSGTLPGWMSEYLTVDTALLIPDELARPLFHLGFICHTSARFDNLDQVRSFVAESRAYFDADRRQVKIVSALEILENIERIAKIQTLVRTFIVFGCGIILALTLGSIAWLEYRQDAYLLALLKSFGVPTFLLLLHMLMENLLLVVAGMLAVRVAWGPFTSLATPLLNSMGFQAAVPAPPTLADYGVILLAGLVGVLLAMVPVAFGLRRRPGLILQ